MFALSVHDLATRSPPSWPQRQPLFRLGDHSSFPPSSSSVLLGPTLSLSLRASFEDHSSFPPPARQTLSAIAARHGVSLSNVAARWVLQRPGVAAVILGARNADHIPVRRGIL
jgi:hypothetical protein